jgi:hypothetical protein
LLEILLERDHVEESSTQVHVDEQIEIAVRTGVVPRHRLFESARTWSTFAASRLRWTTFACIYARRLERAVHNIDVDPEAAAARRELEQDGWTEHV